MVVYKKKLVMSTYTSTLTYHLFKFVFIFTASLQDFKFIIFHFVKLNLYSNHNCLISF